MRPIVRLTRTLAGAGAWTMYVPPVLLGAWAATYLMDVFNFVTSPGMPVTLEYEAQDGGKVRVRAESYAVDVKNRLVLAKGLELFGPGGERIVRLDRAVVTQGEAGQTNVDVTGVNVVLDRLPSGDFNINRILPKAPEEEGPDTATFVTASDIRLLYRDRTRGRTIELSATAKSVSVMGAGDAWVADGGLTLRGVGQIPFKLVLGEEGKFQADLVLAKAEIVPLVPFIDRFLDEGQPVPISARSLLATGKIQVDGSPNETARMYGSLRIGALNLIAQEFKGDFLDADLVFSGTRARGRASSSGSGLRMVADTLLLDWSKEIRLQADGQVNLVSLAALPPALRRELPRGLRVAGGSYAGRFALVGEDWLTQGDLSVARLDAEGETVRQISARVTANPIQVAATIERATWNGAVFDGAASYNLKTDNVKAIASSDRVNFGTLSNRFDLPLTGTGVVQAVVEVNKGKPQFWVSSRGTSRYVMPEGQVITGLSDIRLSGTPERLHIDRALLRGPQGNLAATGFFSPARQTINVQVVGGQIKASTFAKDVTGTAYLAGNVTGTFRNPVFASQVDVLKLKFGETELPWVQLNAGGDLENIKLTDIRAQYGFSRVNADVGLNIKSGIISGNFNSPGIQLAEIIGDQAAGLIRVSNGNLSGTVQNPKLLGDITGGPIAYAGATLTGIEGRLFASNELVRVANGRLTLTDADATGAMNLTGQYNIQSGTGNVDADWTNLPLRPLAQLDDRFGVSGSSDGTAAVTFNDKGLVNGTLSGTLLDLVLNGQALGSGPFQANAQNGEWSATGSVGSIDRFVSLDELKQTRDGNLTGRLSAFQVQGESIIRLARPLWRDASEDVRRVVADLSGIVDGTIEFNRIGGEFAVLTDDLRITRLALGGRDLGTIETSLKREGSNWNLGKFILTQDEQQITARGTVGDDGTLNLEGDVNKLDLSTMAAFAPGAPVIPATADASYLVTGSLENPTVQATLNLVAILRGNTDPDLEPPSLSLSTIELRDGQVNSEGKFQASGFTGSLNFQSPINALMPMSEGVSRNPNDIFQAEARLSDRGIDEFKDLLSFVDFGRSDGSIGGAVQVSGNIDNYQINGGVQYTGRNGVAPKLAFNDVRTEIINPILQVALRGDNLVFNAAGTSSAGGNAAFEAAIPALLPEGGDFARWLETTSLRGTLALTDFKIDEGEVARSNIIQGTLNTIDAEDTLGLASAPLTLSGTLKEPVISGKVALDDGNVDIPEFQEQEGGAAPPINPRFNIALVSRTPLRLRTLASSFVVTANGSLGGSLLRPQADGAMAVRDGVLRLPNARIQLEDGGTVGLTLRTAPDGTPEIEVPVSLTGRTSVTYRRDASTYQRYDITLFVTGDLLEQGELQIVGRSDPGDLSEQEILAIIGQRDLLEALAAGAQDTRNSQFRDALIGLFLPSLSEQLTQSLATTFGLDYLALDYNPFEGAVVSGAKSFNKYLTLEGRRALTQSDFVDRIQYELRLVYRIPSQNTLLSRARFVLSTDNLRPWRIAIEYSFRF